VHALASFQVLHPHWFLSSSAVLQVFFDLPTFPLPSSSCYCAAAVMQWWVPGCLKVLPIPFPFLWLMQVIILPWDLVFFCVW
jgi:hypothetical protein